jgi:D-glycero-beta-D-manno-heptose 1-phosphate adenylyltransferase
VVLSQDQAIAWVAERRARGEIIVFTNGVFDLLHPGHIRYLQSARACGDALIVAINADRSARALEKGADRPITAAAERAELVAALESVDAAVVFDEPTPQEIVFALQPDVLVKGADWAEGTIIGADVVQGRGGRVVRIPLSEGFSTTALIDRVKRGQAGGIR